MGKLVETIIDRFDGGISNDPRDPRENVCQMVGNFDINTNPRKMTPYISSESGDSSASTSKKRNFTIALRTGTTHSLYALGVQSANTRAEILYKNLTISGATDDLNDFTWANTGNHQSSTGTSTAFDLFVYYRKTGRIYGARDGTHIWSYDPSGSVAFNDTEFALTYTNIAQGLVHSLDDILYIPYDNKIARNDNGSWTDAALTLPVFYRITAIAEFGRFLAIAAKNIAGVGNSRVLLWDRQSTTNFLYESIDFGEGQLELIEELDGLLIGISTKIAPSGTNLALNNNRIIFRSYSPAGITKILEINSGANAPSLALIGGRQKRDNRIHFLLSITINGAVRGGVWSFGRGLSGNFNLVQERTYSNDLGASGIDLYNFIYAGDFLFISYVSGGAFAMSKTNDDTSDYSAKSIWESRKFNTGGSSFKKDLKGISIMHEPLDSDGQIVVQYKKDEETSYTTILTNSTDNSISKSAINIESSGAALPKDYKEISFRIESTGGAEITGLSFMEDIKQSRPY